jgi:predicted RNA-binding Zn-ribbon protein involved in translation (DUF1610 family)
MNCTDCGQPVAPERWEIGRHTCPPCGSADARAEVARDFRLVLNPKQGFGIVTADSPDLFNGKSSGR